MLILAGLVAVLALQERSNRHLDSPQRPIAAGPGCRKAGRAGIERDRQDSGRRSPTTRSSNSGRNSRNSAAAFFVLPEEIYLQIKQDIEASHDSSPEAWARLAKAVLGLAQITGEVDSRPNAIRAYKEGIRVLDRLFQIRADHGDLSHVEGRALTQLGRLERDEGNLPAAVSSAERARKILESLCHDQPEVADHRIDLAACAR